MLTSDSILDTITSLTNEAAFEDSAAHLSAVLTPQELRTALAVTTGAKETFWGANKPDDFGAARPHFVLTSFFCCSLTRKLHVYSLNLLIFLKIYY